jgi:hypothetical protein
VTGAELADRVALRDLVDAYGIAVDDRDAAAYTAMFVPDGRLTVYAFGSETPTADYRGEGLGGLIEFVSRYPATLHFVGNHVCELDGDAASGQTYCLAHHLRGDDSTMLLVARYRDVYARVDGGWRFASRDCRLLWREDRP